MYSMLSATIDRWAKSSNMAKTESCFLIRKSWIQVTCVGVSRGWFWLVPELRFVATIATGGRVKFVQTV